MQYFSSAAAAAEEEDEEKARNPKLNLSIEMEFAFVDFLFDHFFLFGRRECAAFFPLLSTVSLWPLFSLLLLLFLCERIYLFAETQNLIHIICYMIYWPMVKMFTHIKTQTCTHARRVNPKWGQKTDRYVCVCACACDCANIIDCSKVRKPSAKRFNVMNCGNVWQPESYESLQI